MTPLFNRLATAAIGDDTPKFLVRQLLQRGYQRIEEDKAADAECDGGVFLDPADGQRVIVIGSAYAYGPDEQFLKFAQWAKARASVSVPKVYSIHTYTCNDEVHFIIEMEHLTLSVESDEVVWSEDNLASLCCLWDDTIGATQEIFPDKLSIMLFAHYGKILNLNPVVEPFDDDTDEKIEAAFAERDQIEAHIIKVARENNNDFAQVLRTLMQGGIAESVFCESDFSLGTMAVRPGTYELVITSPK